MQKLIKTLREKPEHERKIFALSFVSIVVGLIFVVWANSLLNNFATSNSGEIIVKEEEDNKASIIEGFNEAFSSSVEFVESFSKPVSYKSSNNVIDDEDIVEELLNNRVATTTIDSYIYDMGTTTENSENNVENKPDNLEI